MTANKNPMHMPHLRPDQKEKATPPPCARCGKNSQTFPRGLCYVCNHIDLLKTFKGDPKAEAAIAEIERRLAEDPKR